MRSHTRHKMNLLLKKHVLTPVSGWKPYLPVLYAFTIELLELSLFAFALLVTVEAVLPGFVSFRFNLAEPLIVIILLLAAASFMGNRLGAAFPFAPDKKNPIAWIGIMWLAFLLTLSSMRFPSWSAPLIVGSFFGIAYLLWKILFRK